MTNPADDFEIAVVCSDRGQHTRFTLDSKIVVKADGTVTTTTTRMAASEWGRGATVTDPTDGLTSALPPKTPRTTTGARDDYGDERKYRFRCKHCGRRNVPLREETLRRVALGYRDAGKHVLDISRMP